MAPPDNLFLTGLGIVTPAGVGREALRQARRAGALPAAREAAAGIPAAFAVQGDLKGLVRRKGLAALSRSALLAAAAIEDLLAERPGLLPEAAPGECALVVGTAFGHIESKWDFHRQALADGVRLVSPIVFPNTLINSLAGHAAILYGLTGPNSTVTSGRRSGLEALIRAAGLLRAGRARRAIVLGCEEVSPSLLRALQARAARGKIEPSPPPGEAAVAILLESEESARAGGRRAEAALLGAAEESFVGRSRLDAVGAAVAGALAGARRGGGPAGTVFTCGDLGAEVEDSVLRSNPATAAAATARVETLFGETFGAAGALGLACAVLSRPEGGPPQTALVLAVEDDGATAVVLQMGDQGAP